MQIVKRVGRKEVFIKTQYATPCESRVSFFNTGFKAVSGDRSLLHGLERPETLVKFLRRRTGDELYPRLYQAMELITKL